MHSERPIPQMETERRAMKLLRLLVETYLVGGGGHDWRFCMLAASILSDIAMNNATKGNRLKVLVRKVSNTIGQELIWTMNLRS